MRRWVRLALRLCVLALVSWASVAVVGASTIKSVDTTINEVTSIFEFHDGVIVDAAKAVAHIMNPEGGIDTIDLTSGQRLWSTNDAAKPLLLRGRRLFAQAKPGTPSNRLRIVILDVQRAGKVILEATARLPGNVQVMVVDGLGKSFRTSARLHDDKVIVVWQYSEQEVEGPPPGPGSEPHVTTGAVQIDLETGRTETARTGTVESTPHMQLPDRVARWMMQAKPSGPVWRIGNVLAAIERTSDRGEPRTVLRRWHSSSGRPLPDVDLSDDAFTYRYVSADGRHALASKRLGAANRNWLWRLYSLETGQQVAEIRNDTPGAHFFITASRLVHEAPPTRRISSGGTVVDQPPRLRAIDLATSAEVWLRPFRDTAYRGPFPPGTGGARAPSERQ